jgi:sulfite exporter TauE/SafE
MLGALLGALGSLVELSPFTLAILQLAIGVFMVGNALRMLDVHPIFRYFVIEPPKIITRTIRQVSKHGQADFATPLLLGTLTVLIPCGVTQAMMALAIGTGSPLRGAVILFAFTLGTSPLLFALAYATTRLGAQLEASFLKLVALAIFTLGLLSINYGFSALGLPLSFDDLADTLVPASAPATAPVQTTPVLAAPIVQPKAPTGSAQELVIDVRSGGYVPNDLKAKAGVPVKLSLVTNRVFT